MVALVAAYIDTAAYRCVTADTPSVAWAKRVLVFAPGISYANVFSRGYEIANVCALSHVIWTVNASVPAHAHAANSLHFA